MRRSGARPQEATQAGQPESGEALAGQGGHGHPQAPPQVAVGIPRAPGGQGPQAVQGVVVEVGGPGLLAGGRDQEQVAVLGHEQEEQPVDQAQQLPVVVLAVQGAAGQRLPQLVVGPMGEEPLAQGDDGGLHPGAQAIQGPGALDPRLVVPALQPAGLGAGGLHPALVADEPEQGKVGVDLAGHDGLEVELQVGGAGQAGVVPQGPQARPVGADGPQVLFRAVEQLLDHGVGGHRLGYPGRRPRHPPAAPVQLDARSHQMDGDRPPDVGDRVRLGLDLDGPGRQQAPVAQLGHEREWR